MINPKNKRSIILSVILGIILVYYFIDSGTFTNDNTKTLGSDLTKSISGYDSEEFDDEDIKRIIELASVVEVSWANDWDKDPFFYISPESLSTRSKGGLISGIFGTVEEATSAVGLSLTGISWHGNSGYAIINGQIAKENDVISGYTIEKITIDHVILKQDLRTLRLTLDDH